MTTFANKKVLGVLLGVAAAIVLTACGRSDDNGSTFGSDSNRIRVPDHVFGLMGSTKIAVAETYFTDSKGGYCPPPPNMYSKPTLSNNNATAEFLDAGEGRCTITFTLGQFDGKESVLNGGKITLTSKKENDTLSWSCSSDLPDKYLPKRLRDGKTMCM